MAFTTVRSATGVDFIGTPGVDVGIIFDETGKVMLSGLGDADLINVENSTRIQRTSTINGGDGADQITFTTSVSDSSINGNKGADTIIMNFSTSNSFIGGGEGADSIFGGVQFLASKIEGGAGADSIEIADNLALATVNGGDGNDTIDLTPFGFIGTQIFNNASINGNAGSDTIDGRQLDVALTGANFIGGGANDDTINFLDATTNGTSAAFAKGFDLTGGSGNDVINGSNDNDTIFGNADNDTISGNEGRDTIFAGAGKDTINVGRLAQPLFPLPPFPPFPVDSGDVITGGGGGDIFLKSNAATTATFNINSIAESAADTSGTAAAATLTFDSFINYAFAANDRLNISAVVNELAGGPLASGATLAQTNIGGVFTATDFAGLKTQLDALAFTAGSTTGGINAYNFTATIGAPGSLVTANYLWIQDGQKAYSSSDLLFQTQAFGGITPAQITLV